MIVVPMKDADRVTWPGGVVAWAKVVDDAPGWSLGRVTYSMAVIEASRAIPGRPKDQREMVVRPVVVETMILRFHHVLGDRGWMGWHREDSGKWEGQGGQIRPAGLMPFNIASEGGKAYVVAGHAG